MVFFKSNQLIILLELYSLHLVKLQQDCPSFFIANKLINNFLRDFSVEESQQHSSFGNPLKVTDLQFVNILDLKPYVCGYIVSLLILFGLHQHLIRDPS